MEGRGSTVMDSTSQNEIRSHNESISFGAALIVTKAMYHGARTHYVTVRSTPWDEHPLVHLSGDLALLRRMRRVARCSANAAPQPLTLTPLSVTHTITHIRSHCPSCQDVVAYCTASLPAKDQGQRCLQPTPGKGGSQGAWRIPTKKPYKPTLCPRRTLHAPLVYRLALSLWSLGQKKTHAPFIPFCRASNPAAAQGISLPVQGASPAKVWASARPSRAYGHYLRPSTHCETLSDTYKMSLHN